MSIDIDIQIDEKIKINIEEPSLYKVILLNDDTTPMEWVIDVLTRIFHHSQETAEKITLQIHHEGAEVVGLYNYEIAEQKVVETISASRERGFPLIAKIEKE